jgi:hypothetical protein
VQYGGPGILTISLVPAVEPSLRQTAVSKFGKNAVLLTAAIPKGEPPS